MQPCRSSLVLQTAKRSTVSQDLPIGGKAVGADVSFGLFLQSLHTVGLRGTLRLEEGMASLQCDFDF